MSIIKATNIVKQYSAHRALDDVSIEIPRGSVYGLLGPNGAGKTTLIRIINQITAPDSGEVFFDDRKAIPNDVYRIGYMPEERGLYKKMKVGEQALYLSRLKGLSRQDAMTSLKKWFTKFEIQGWWDRKIEELSKGMAQKVQFIITVIHKPELLIFDEPFSGFDPVNANLLKDEILELQKNGSTIIFSTHNMGSVEEICSHITLINKSRNILSGEVDYIRRQHGNNSFRLDYKGNTAELLETLQATNPEISAHTIEDQLNARYQSLSITLPYGQLPREIISKLNEKVDIHNFVEEIPSMNDIFINAVK